MKVSDLILEADFGIRKIDDLLKSYGDWTIDKLKTQKSNYYGGKRTENYRILTHTNGQRVYLKNC